MTVTALGEKAAARPTRFSEAEWESRVQLAAAYRVFDLIGWTELIYNHITLRLPGPESHFLINPFGLHYSEVTASNLVKIDLDGRKVDDSPHRVNPAGFVIHSAIHAARDDAHCIMHTHTTAGMAVACKRDGLTPSNFYASMLYGEIAYHDFEGLTTTEDERPRLVASLGDRNLMILRSHGLLSCGKTIPLAFMRLWTLQRACDVQAAAAAIPGETIEFDEAVLAKSKRAVAEDYDGWGEIDFAALQRLVDARDPSYRQ